MSVKLRKQINKNSISLYLDVHVNNERSRIYLKHKLIANPKTTDDRELNKTSLRLAEAERVKLETSIMYEDSGMINPLNQEKKVTEYLQTFCDNYKKADKKKVDAMLMRFKDFQGAKEYRFKQVNENVVNDFKTHLETLSGETARAYFGKFKQALKRANIEKLCRYDIRTFEGRFKKDSNLKKEFLTESELIKLWNTPLENETLKDAFMFSCFTGLRPVDVRSLKGSDVQNGFFRKEQSKTKKKIDVPLGETAIGIFNKYKKGANEYLFEDLPTQNGWNKGLKSWIEKAEINKHITTYCSRHTFCMMLLDKGVDWRSIIDFMGWSESNGMKMLFVYTRAREKSLSDVAANLLRLGFESY